jgi:hypothetical protein
MKIVILSLVLASLGLGSWQLAGRGASASAPGGCDATVTCTPQGTCLIECTGPNGQSCSIELACDGETCEVVGSSCSEPCASACSAAPCGAK